MMRISSSDWEDVNRWQGYSTLLHKYYRAYCLYLIHDLYKTEPCIKLLRIAEEVSGYVPVTETAGITTH